MQTNTPDPKPLLVNCQTAQHLLGVRNTKFWALVKAGAVETVKLGDRTMVRYASLERLAEPKAA
ncbi:excisionase [Lichenicola cladoniae]|uniref:Excisionase n=1 Tax=Lichenicola cladoniae TaxID=1484109 RepID=A0A6M8HL93_9PROT|nr:excisionase [Lichenicola cladoniae]NPD68930.1 excisionase [Acetobacteraceae bacterium]QKE89124.1 excisionase [Lichenicola cladoniae]